MAAVYEKEKIGLRRTPDFVTIVPEVPVAQLMFYLDCICTVLDVDENKETLARLRDYSRHYLLTESETDKLIQLCVKFAPAHLGGICIFHKPEMCGSLPNKFYELESVRDQLVVAGDVVIRGEQRRVLKIMVHTEDWFINFYSSPMAFLFPIFVRRMKLMVSQIKQVANGISVVDIDMSLPSYSDTTIQGNDQSNATVKQTSKCCIIL